MGGPSLLRIERWNYAVGGVLIAVSALTQSESVSLGIAVGVLLTCANFYALRKLVTKWTTDAQQNRHGNAQLLMLPKMAVLMAAVACAILFLPMNVIAFVIGFSIFMVSIVAETTYSVLRPQPASDPSEPSEHKHG
ncbi:MAG TPA: ATP synthase subunit I [Kofleriaceae bacterium]